MFNNKRKQFFWFTVELKIRIWKKCDENNLSNSEWLGDMLNVKKYLNYDEENVFFRKNFV